MSRTLIAAALTLAGCVCLSVQARADDKDEAKSDDAAFVKMAAMGNLTEIQLGTLASRNGEAAAVKAFAQKMVQDHSKANGDLAKIAAAKNYKTPSDLDDKHAAVVKQLGTLKGSEFDRKYMEHMVMSHKKGVKLYESQSKNGEDAELKAFAAKTLPVVQEHLKMAESIASKVATGPER